MQINAKIVKKQFEKTIEKYNENAIVQATMACRLVQILQNYGTEFDKILELGSGTGILTQEIIQNFKFKKYLANDFVTKSKKFIDKIYPENIFICGNAQKIRPNCKVNLVISNAMFQWFRSIDTSHFAGMLEKGGILAFTTFSPQNFKEIRDITGLSLKYKTTEELKKELALRFVPTRKLNILLFCLMNMRMFLLRRL